MKQPAFKNLTKALATNLRSAMEVRAFVYGLEAKIHQKYGDTFEAANNFDDNEIFLRHARTQLTVSENSALQKLFSAVAMDPENPRDWKLLMNVFAETFFGNRGRPQKWSETEYLELYLASERLRRGKGIKADIKICRELKKNAQFSSLDIETLRKRLRHARDPKKHSYLLFPENRNVVAKYLRLRFEKGGSVYSPIMQEYLDEVIRLLKIGDGF